MHSPEPLPDVNVPDRAAFDALVRARAEPVVIRGLVRNWPLYAAAARSRATLAAYLGGFYNGTPLTIMNGKPENGGRLFYDESLRRLNFEVRQASLDVALATIFESAAAAVPATTYIGSAAENQYWPGLARANAMPLVADSVVPNVWIGGRAVVGAHNDHPENLACVVTGRRRFRLFPPEEFANLYVGPLELNPAGRPVSFVSVSTPDYIRYPRYARALAASRDAVLEPGDAIYIPSLWWHSVESLAPFNVLVNYWWDTPEAIPARAEAALVHALFAFGTLTQPQRLAWKAVFDHLVFRADGDPVEHIPPVIRGLLGDLTPDLRDAMRNLIRRSLID